MSKTYTVPELAEILGLTTTRVYRDLQSFPYTGHNASDIKFTEDDVAEIRKILDAGPDEQAERLMLLEAKRAEIRDIDGDA